MSRCPTCRAATAKSVPPQPVNKFYPFCCERCSLLDLGRWLNEEYRVAADAEDGSAVRELSTDEE